MSLAAGVLVDTSVLVNSLRRQLTPAVQEFQRLLATGRTPAITPEVYREVLQGARDEPHFRALRERLAKMPLRVPADIYNSHTQAAQLYAALRWRGITVRSAVDCLIAQTAIEHDLMLLHDDADYVSITRLEPRLRLFAGISQ
jgi:predicted nucleic acid-binding protein